MILKNSLPAHGLNFAVNMLSDWNESGAVVVKEVQRWPVDQNAEFTREQCGSVEAKSKKKTSGGFQVSNQTIGPSDFMNTDLEVYNNMRLRESFQSESLG
jgi:hypothetical protein